MTRAASESCCGRCARPGPTTRPVPCSTATRPPRPASTGSAGVAWLLEALAEAGADDAARTLAARAAAQASLDNPLGVAVLLGVLHGAGADDAARTLAARAAQASFDDPGGVAWLLPVLRGAGPATRPVPWPPGPPPRPASITRAASHSCCRRCGVEAGADDAARTLLDRDPAAQASLDDPGGVAWLLEALRGAGADDAARALAARAAAQASLDNPGGVGALLQALAEAGADDAARTLAARAAAQASLDNPGGVARAAAGAGAGRPGPATRPRPARPRPRRPGQPR